jgi:hypothetical protein
MANHVYCSLEISGDEEELKKFFEDNKGDEEDLDFQKATPPTPQGVNEYAWLCDTWGTKWNAQESFHDFYSMPDDDGVIQHSLHYTFYTAWDEPYGWFKLVAQKYPNLEFFMKFEDEAWIHCGEHEAFNGVVDYNKYEQGDPQFEEIFKERRGEEEWEEFISEQEEQNE